MLNVDDDGFVRAPVGLVYRRLTDVDRWGDWWPGVTTARIGEDTWEITASAGRLARPQRMVMGDVTWRHDAGFGYQLTGDLTGHAEFWLEPGWGGTVVHHLVDAHTDGNPLQQVRRYRKVLRRGLWGFKDALQDEVRGALGLAP